MPGSSNRKLSRAVPIIGSGLRATLVALVAVLLLVAAGIFVTWNVDYWQLRDRFVHISDALFGDYIPPVCRQNPDDCVDGKLKPKSKKILSKAELCVNEPGLDLHCQLQTIHGDFNRELFSGKLPYAVITLQRKPNAAGYYAHRRFKLGAGGTIDEIALNPSTFRGKSMLRLASTVAHEMCHQEIGHFGSPGKNGFHTMSWARCMLRIGLRPTTTGRPGGAMTGTRVTHLIVPGGPFERIARAHPFIGHRKVALFE